MQRPLQVLTNLQVHVLNPVDILRAAMDEGVLCFPYGDLLDKAFGLLDKVEQVMGMSEEDGDVSLQSEFVVISNDHSRSTTNGITSYPMKAYRPYLRALF